MDGFIFILLILLALTACLLYGMKGTGKRVVYLTAVTLLAWCVGLLLDAYIDFGIDLAFRILFPILAMGLCILKAAAKSKED